MDFETQHLKLSNNGMSLFTAKMVVSIFATELFVKMSVVYNVLKYTF